jgi:hypothetical protein
MHPKNAKGLNKKTFDEKEAASKTQRSLTKRPLMKNAKELNKKTSDEKRGTPKT